MIQKQYIYPLYMNRKYVSGFFDADGSVQLTRIHKNQNPTPVITFHNNEKSILQKIAEFIYSELGIKGYLRSKKKIGYKDQYELRYTYYPKVLKIYDRLDVLHSKKIERLELIKELYSHQKRNGKYNRVEGKLYRNLLARWK